MQELKIGTSWVRGVVGEALTPELIVDFACAFGTWSDGGPVVIGSDTRRSSTMFRAAVVSGLLSPGCDVIDLGVCPTPLISFAVRELAATGGISITGSHNDDRWNALKFVGPDGALFNPVRSEELLDIYHASVFRSRPRDRVHTIDDVPGVADRYIECLLSALDTEPIRARRFTVAVDFCNGACAAMTRRFLAELDATIAPLNEGASPRFAHDPAPSPSGMEPLGRLVRESGADIGVAINVDGDRIAFATDRGELLSEECSLPLAARGRLERRPGPIVTSLSTSRMVDAVAADHGQPVIRTLVGEGHVMDRGLEENAVLAGEGCGGIGVLPVATAYDALLALGLTLEALSTGDASLPDIVASLPSYVMLKGGIPCPAHQVYRILEGFRTRWSDRSPDSTDGVRVDWDDAWLHVRASNTEPLLRVIVEAETEARARELFDDAMAQGRRAVREETGGA